jgi:hypothetical protein
MRYEEKKLEIPVGGVDFWYRDVYGCDLRKKYDTDPDEEWLVFLGVGNCLGWWVLQAGVFKVFYVHHYETPEYRTADIEEIHKEDLRVSGDVRCDCVKWAFVDEDRRIRCVCLAVLKLLDRHLGGTVMIEREWAL